MKSTPKPRGTAQGPTPQAELFGDVPAGAPAAGPALLVIDVPAAVQSKAQRLFNSLIGQIRQQRELLASWQQFETRHNQRLATDFQPAQAKLTAARKQLLLLLDHLLSDQRAEPRLSKGHRRKLQAWIPQLADAVLEGGPDAEVEALFDRYSDISHADRQQIELAEAEAMFGHILGEEMIDGHQAETVEDLMRHAEESLARANAEQAERASAKAPHARSTKARAAQQRKAELAQQAAQQAGQTVREAFRKLASALHPDREPDPAERERKTRLMQQANQAYERNDLLTLLTMQLDLEQIDAQHLANLPEARLAHYNRVLREQLAALQQELGECTEPFRMMLGLDQRALTPATVDAVLARDIQELRRSTRLIELDIAQLRDPATRRAAIAAIEVPDLDDDDGPDAFEAMLLMEAFAGAPGFGRPGKKKRRR